jgi:hypothetical protein
MSREVRRVPANWQHPKRLYERRGEIVEEYRPMMQGSFEDAVKSFHENVEEWVKGYRLWQEGFCDSYDGRHTKAEKFKHWLESIEEDRARWKFSGDYQELAKKRYETGLCSWADVEGEPPCYPNPDDYMPEGD